MTQKNFHHFTVYVTLPAFSNFNYNTLILISIFNDFVFLIIKDEQ